MTKRIFIERLEKLSEAGNFDREFWKQAGHEAHFAAAADMVVETELFICNKSSLNRLAEFLKEAGDGDVVPASE